MVGETEGVGDCRLLRAATRSSVQNRGAIFLSFLLFSAIPQPPPHHKVRLPRLPRLINHHRSFVGLAGDCEGVVELICRVCRPVVQGPGRRDRERKNCLPILNELLVLIETITTASVMDGEVELTLIAGPSSRDKLPRCSRTKITNSTGSKNLAGVTEIGGEGWKT